jgi:hypothetical protein
MRGLVREGKGGIHRKDRECGGRQETTANLLRTAVLLDEALCVGGVVLMSSVASGQCCVIYLARP